MRSMTPELERVGDIRNALGETPVWSAREDALYWINVEHDPEILRWDSASGDIRRWPMPERIGGLVLKEKGGALVVLASGLYDFDFATGQLSLRVKSPLSDPVALHECVCDPTGRFWVGSMNQTVGAGNAFPGGGAMFRLEGNELVREFDGISCANGLAFSPDGRVMYFSDSTTKRCDRYDVDPATGKLGPRETFFQLGEDEGFVDGAAVDTEGGYWCPLVYVGKLRRYLPDGTPDIEVNLPFGNPTKVSFGGTDMRKIFVTSTAQTLDHESDNPLDGGLFCFEPGYTGQPDPLFPG